MKKIYRLISILLAVVLFSSFVSPTVQAQKVNSKTDTDISEPEPSPIPSPAPEPELVEDNLLLLKGGDPVQILVTTGTIINAVPENMDVVSVTPAGLVNALIPGKTYVEITVKGPDEEIYVLYCHVTVADPGLSDSKVELLLNKQTVKGITITGTDDISFYEPVISSSNKKVAEAYMDYYDNKVYIEGKKAGSAVITINVCGKKLTCQVTVKYYQISKDTLTVTKGTKRTLKITGTKDKVKWSITNNKIASITSKGVVTAKKNGNTTVKASVNGVTLRCYISVANSRAIKAVSKARSAIGAKYSQAKRMQKGFYDCSSLVWRSYSPYGIKLGSSNWAPTAANEAKWCSSAKKVVSKKGIPLKDRKLLPGDLIFYSRKSNQNGRYLNIYHVAIFAGYDVSRYQLNNPTLYGVLIEADGSYVSENFYSDYYGDDKKIVMIARPAK